MRRYLAAYAAAVYAFLYVPLAVLSVFSFNSSRFAVWQGFSLRWYGEALHNQQMMDAALNSLIIGVCVGRLRIIFRSVILILAAEMIYNGATGRI